MARSDSTSQWQLLPPFLFVLLLSFGAYWAPWPLEGERPSQSLGPLSLEGVQTVDARLWQDPFAAVHRHREREEKPSAQARGKHPASLEELGQLAGDKCAGRGCEVLGVMVFGGPYMGTEEFRRRTRYAVLAGLNSHGYSPEDSEHIGYVSPQKSGGPILPHMVVPFEWLTRESGGSPLLLLWLDEDALTREGWQTSHPLPSAAEDKIEIDVLDRLNTLFEPIERGCPICRPTLIGPASSGTLIKMVEEWGKDGLPPAFLSAEGAKRWYAYSPTAGTAWSLAHDHQPALPIVRVTSKDDDLIGKLPDAESGEKGAGLLEELRLRGIPGDGLVALVGQWDTTYSRNLIDLLEQGLRKEGKNRVIVAYYLRGLDGELPKREGDENDVEAKAAREKTPQDKARQVERPEGDTQTDYLRRLIPALKHREREAADRSGARVRAVGILGDDYHDKLLVLKALQHAFPDAVFFTTDLDAAMLHPGDNRHTRNLVVALSFGLSLGTHVHGPFAPFRDSYQTGAYLATRIALHNALHAEKPLGQQQIEQAIEPLVFEIGRRSAVRLNGPPQDANQEGAGLKDWHALGEHPDWQPQWDNRPSPLAGLGALLVIAGVGWLATMLSSIVRRFWLEHAWALSVGLFSAAALAIWLYLNLPAPLGEPFSWVEGVSIWPTEILRLLILLLTGVLLLHCSRQLRLGDAEIRTAFFPDQDDQGGLPVADPTVPSARDRWRLYQARQIPTAMLDVVPKTGFSPPEPRWALKDVLRQLLWPLVLYFVIAAGLMLLFGFPKVPVRGLGMMVLDGILLALAVLGFALLLFRVLDASRRAVWLAYGLKGPHTWPESTLFEHGCRQLQDEKYFDDYLDVRVVAAASARVQRMVYYPFLVFILLILSRSAIFDAWYVPPSLYLVFAFALGLIVLAVGWLRRTAEQVREGSLSRMEDQLLEVQGRGKEGEGLRKQIETMIEQIRTTREGAFAPISQQPLVRAILLLAGSISGIAWLEAVSNAAL